MTRIITINTIQGMTNDNNEVNLPAKTETAATQMAAIRFNGRCSGPKIFVFSNKA